ncbi:MAG: YfiR family protein [Chryseosolibacter sp.]
MIKPLKRIVLSLFLTVATSLAPAQNPSAEYQVKGAFLFNFAQFTEWPSQVFSAAEDPFVIGILGNDPYGQFLDEFVRGENIRGRPVMVKRFSSIKEIESVHLLFIHNEFQISTEDLTNLAVENILTVSDAPGFTKKGGIINFYRENNKVRFEVNVDAARSAHVTLSSKLLRLAKICCDTAE